MSFAGLKKQFNKADQFVSEKIRGTEGTKLDANYIETSKKVDVISKLVEELLIRTQELLQPNPAYRAKLLTVNTINKLQGRVKCTQTPQPEGLVGECMLKYGMDLGSDSLLGQCLSHSGESFKYLSELKCSMEDHVKESFLKHLHNLQNHDLKEINFHRKKMEGRRLDYDCKKRKQEKAAVPAKLPEDEVKIAEEKFLESKVLSEQAMINFLNLEVEQIQAISEFVSAQFDYYRQATELMEQLQKFLIDKKDEAVAQPKTTYQMTSVACARNNDSDDRNQHYPSTYSSTNNVISSSSNFKTKQPYCVALYDFEAENDAELPFLKDDEIVLTRQLDENWFEGELKGRRGYFPINYVEVKVNLP